METWVPVPEGSGFGARNLPYGVFSRRGELPRVGVAIGEYVLDLAELATAELLADRRWFAAGLLNRFMAGGPAGWEPARGPPTAPLADGAEPRQVEPPLPPPAHVQL